MYRARWQVELVWKKMKPLLRLQAEALRHIHMRHLTTRMNPRICAAATLHTDRLLHDLTKHRLKLLPLLLDGLLGQQQIAIGVLHREDVFAQSTAKLQQQNNHQRRGRGD